MAIAHTATVKSPACARAASTARASSATISSFVPAAGLALSTTSPMSSPAADMQAASTLVPPTSTATTAS
jgi:hypothetical protein